MSKVDLSHLLTESRNPKTMDLDDMSVREFLKVMNEEDATIADKIKTVLPEIEEAVYQVIHTLNQGGRIFYVGSGTSGRLGVMDAVECPPTFGTTDEINGIIAGGSSAFVKAKEGAEDNESNGFNDLKKAGFTQKDLLIGIAASGRTPHTIGALKMANELGAYTISIACNPNSESGQIAGLAIDIPTGPEVITGSTRLRAGTAQKMVLNMISTAAMVGIGKTYSNLMVDMKVTNEKLLERGRHIIMEATGCNYEEASTIYDESGRCAKTAIVMVLLECDREQAEQRLSRAKGFVKKALTI